MLESLLVLGAAVAEWQRHRQPWISISIFTTLGRYGHIRLLLLLLLLRCS
jgi:hypothetical protein